MPFALTFKQIVVQYRLSYMFRALSIFLLYISIPVAIAYPALISFLDPRGHDDWGLTVWLINYQGGLVRRGWPGEIIYQAWQNLGLSPRFSVAFISYVLLAVMLAVVLRRLRKLYPTELLISGAIFGMPVFAHGAIQKDVFGIVLFTLGLAICSSISSVRLAQILLASVICLATLSHETFLFFGAPAVIAAFGLRLRQSGQEAGRIAMSLFPLSLATLGSAWFVSRFKGTPEIAQAIHDTWLPLWYQADGEGCCTEPAASFRALGWSLDTGVRQQAIVLDDFSLFIYVPAAWAITIFVIFFLLVAAARVNTRAERTALAAICLLQFFCVAPLFILGLDFGRWIFAWSATTVLLVHHIQQEHPTFMSRFPLGGRAISKTVQVHPAWLLIFAVPATQWSVYKYLQATPLGALGFPTLRLLEDVFNVNISLG